MANNGNRTPVLDETQSLNGTPKINTPRLNLPSLNVANLSRRLNTLKRKSPNENNQNNQNNQKNQNNQRTPMKRPAVASGPGLSSEERQRRYARSKNQVVFWRANPETGEAEMIKEEKAKVGGRRSRKAHKARKARKGRKTHRRH